MAGKCRFLLTELSGVLIPICKPHHQNVPSQNRCEPRPQNFPSKCTSPNFEATSAAIWRGGATSLATLIGRWKSNFRSHANRIKLAANSFCTSLETNQAHSICRRCGCGWQGSATAFRPLHQGQKSKAKWAVQLLMAHGRLAARALLGDFLTLSFLLSSPLALLIKIDGIFPIYLQGVVNPRVGHDTVTRPAASRVYQVYKVLNYDMKFYSSLFMLFWPARDTRARGHNLYVIFNTLLIPVGHRVKTFLDLAAPSIFWWRATESAYSWVDNLTTHGYGWMDAFFVFFIAVAAALCIVFFRAHWIRPCFCRSRSICCRFNCCATRFNVCSLGINFSSAQSADELFLRASERESIRGALSLLRSHGDEFGEHLFILLRFMGCSQKPVYDSSQFLLSVLWIMYRGCSDFAPQVKWM